MELGDVTLAQYVLVAVAAFASGLMGGITGYGSGLLMPPVLVPIIGAQAAVPVISVAALFTNATRLWAFWADCDRTKAAIVVTCALPTTALGAWGFTLLTGRGALILIGAMLVVLVGLRRIIKRLEWQLDDKRLAAVSVGYGLVTGGTSGAGVMLLSMLMWSGLAGASVIATDAAVTLVLVTVKALTFQTFGALPLSSWIMAVLIGLAGTPGAFLAKRLTARLSLDQHAAILDAVVVVAGLAMIWQALV